MSFLKVKRLSHYNNLKTTFLHYDTKSNKQEIAKIFISILHIPS